MQFQSTLPVRGATMLLPAFTGSVMPFQSTLPVRGATTRSRCCPGGACISIHAPRAGSDFPRPLSRVWPPYFNPRSPCGERRAVRFAARLTDSFQSTLPVRGATRPPKRTYQRDETISIHAPRAGSDAYCRKALRLVGGFQSTLPVRGATIRSRHITPRSRFQSTLPVRGATVHPPDRTGHH